MKEAIGAYRAVAATDEFKEIERQRFYASHNRASALGHAQKKKAIEIAKKMLADNEPLEKIVKYTGLKQKDVDALRDADK